MVSVTLSIPKETRELMNKFSEINWSGFIRGSIEKKVGELSWKEEMLQKLKEEDECGFTDWTIKMGRKTKEESFRKLVSGLSKAEKKELGL